MIRALIFDLDDTLYPERDFVASGCRAVARYVEQRYRVAAGEVFAAMMETLAERGRRHIMPVVIERYLMRSVPLSELVEVYRQHNPEIGLFAGYPELLRNFARNYRLGLITDGLPEVQKRKVKALLLDQYLHNILFTWDYGPEREKPHPFSFTLMLQLLQVAPRQALFVGDNPEKDVPGALAVGMQCALVQNPGSPGVSTLDRSSDQDVHVLKGLSELPEFLELMR